MSSAGERSAEQPQSTAARLVGHKMASVNQTRDDCIHKCNRLLVKCLITMTVIAIIFVLKHLQKENKTYLHGLM